jgi:hypothetical protein
VINQQARKFRVEIRHLDGDDSGKEENVPRGRLKVPWVEVAQYDASMDDWKLLREESIDQNESSAMWTAVELLIPSAVAELFLTPVDDALVIHDRSALESLTGQPLTALPTNRSSITYNGSWAGCRDKAIPGAVGGLVGSAGGKFVEWLKFPGTGRHL